MNGSLISPSTISLFETNEQKEVKNPSFQFTYEVNTPAVAGEGKPRRAYSSKGPIPDLPPNVPTLHDNLLHGASICGSKPFLGKRKIIDGKFAEFEYLTYDEIVKRVTNFGSALVNSGIPPKSHIGLFSQNNIEWVKKYLIKVIAEHACFKYDYVTVPLYDTLGEDAIEHIVNLCEIPLIVCTKDKAEILFKLKDKLKKLTNIVLMDETASSVPSSWGKSGLVVSDMIELELQGSKKIQKRVPTTKDSIATVCFTSGTTGLPKGAMLSHGNLLSFLAGALQMIENKNLYNITSEDSYISYLPLAHIMERALQVILTYHGATIGFFQGDIQKLMEDIAELKPTIFVSVPRLYNRIYDKVLSSVKAAGGIKSALFNHAFNAKKLWLEAGYVHHNIWDRIVFGAVRQKLGGRVKMMMTGAAPISKEVIEFLRICFSCQVYEGYGQTECTAGLSTSLTADFSKGHVGVPMPQNLVKLRDVPSMNYYSTDKPFPRGEICCKGANVFKGYYKQPEKTAEALSADGWLYTGDVGYWDAKGRLVIIDRVKNIFKLAQGEYIAPEKIENVYIKHELVAQAYVHGDSLQSYLVAVIVPDVELFMPWATKHNFTGTFQEIITKPEVTKAVLNELTEFGRANDLKGFEIARTIYLDSELFSVQNGLLTPSFKLKRNEAKAKYQTEINRMYSENK